MSKINTFTLFRDVCNTKKIVSTASMFEDLDYYYRWKLTEDVANKMLAQYELFLASLWAYIKVNKNPTLDEDTQEFKTPLINNEDGVYFNVLKIDFQRAFTNYIVKVLDEKHLNIIKEFFEKIAVLYLPTKAKKFLYNYTLTNIIVNMLGKKTLANLRRTVYEDVLYLSGHVGEVIKTEVDGVYLATPLTELPVFDVYGQLTISSYKWIIWTNPIMIGLQDIKKIPTVKGLGKDVPNVLYRTLENIAKGHNTDRDRIIEDFLYSPTIHLPEWFFKTDDGNKVTLLGKNSEISVESKTYKDLEDMCMLIPNIDRDKYLEYIQNTLTTIYELIG